MHKHGRLSALGVVFSQSSESKITVIQLSSGPPVMPALGGNYGYTCLNIIPYSSNLLMKI